jgi:DDE superfamily endonuclease
MVGANLAGDIKLPPRVIFEGLSGRTGRVKREIEIKVRYLVEQELDAQKNGWMDEEKMHWVVEKDWKPMVARLEISFIPLDCCKSHLITSVKEAFNDCNVELDFKPKGYTCKLQAMYIGINKPLQNFIQFDPWLIVNRDLKTEASRCCLVDLDQMVRDL